MISRAWSDAEQVSYLRRWARPLSATRLQEESDPPTSSIPSLFDSLAPASSDSPLSALVGVLTAPAAAPSAGGVASRMR